MEAIRKIIFRQEVKKIIHIKADSTLQSMINAGEFPQGFRVGLRRRGWYEDDVLAWQKEREQGNDSNLLIVFYVQIMPDDFVMQLHRF